MSVVKDPGIGDVFVMPFHDNFIGSVLHFKLSVDHPSSKGELT